MTSGGLVFVPQNELIEKGRLQYFYHAPSSKLPVRDLLNEQGRGYKTEPHIEAGAENLWKPCFQSNNILPHISSQERYLFLMTTCRNRAVKSVYGQKSVVGYIDKKGWGAHTVDDQNISFVFGDVKLFGFENALPLSRLGYSSWTRVKLVDEDETQKILNHFKDLDNIVDACIEEINRLDPEANACYSQGGYECPFLEQCQRLNSF